MKGRRLDARYTLIDKLGAGGQGEVWRAHDGVRGIDIALKVLNPALARSDSSWSTLEHEYAIASLLDHPSILKVFPPDRSGDVMVLPMELASGGDLRRLRGAGFLEIIPVLLEIAQALEHAHDRGVVHRDLKPGNVLFDARGRARLADFGVAETAMTGLEVKGSVSPDGTRDGARHGLSPFTASPAQLLGAPPTPADDVYGLGALAYELLSGYPPYYPHFDRKRAIEEAVPELVPTRQIPPLLGAIVTRMLAKDPAERPGTMREVIDELDAALNDTLTFDFENVSSPLRGLAADDDAPAATSQASHSATRSSQAGSAAGPRVSATGAAIELPAMFVSDEPAANMSEGPPGTPEWSPTTGRDRRSTADRRGRRSADRVEPEWREPTAAPADPSAALPPAPPTQTQLATPTQPPAPKAAFWPATAPAPNTTPSVTASNSTRAVTTESAPAARSAAPASGAAPTADIVPMTASRNTAVRGSRAEPALGSVDARPTWGEIPLDGLPKVTRLEPIRTRRWPWVLLGLLAGAVAAVYFWLPRLGTEDLPSGVAAVVAPLQSALGSDPTPGTMSESQSPAVTPTPAGELVSPGTPAGGAEASAAPPSASHQPAATGDGAVGTAVPAADQVAAPGTAQDTAQGAVSGASASFEERSMRQSFENRLAVFEARGAGVWGGRDFALAKTRAAESIGARDAGNPKLAQERLAAASRLLDAVEMKAPQALTAQVAAGDKALGTGQQQVAGQAFELARRIDPGDRRAFEGQRRANSLNGVLPLLADAQNAEVARDYARAAQDYSQALSLDPGNATAKAGQARANAAFGDDTYARAIGQGFASLGAGRLDSAHDAFVKARALKPNGAEASEGLRRVGAALTARGFASIRTRAAGLENQERWDEAEQAYEDVLSADSSLAFAQEGKARASSRAELAGRLQQFIDRPERMGAPGVREEARELLETAYAQSPSGPVLRSQMARLQILLPAFDRPVRLSLLSDNSTQVAISSIGTFGTFSHREIEIRPGRYVVVGTRYGFRDVRREITVAPGQEIQTIRVTCSEPI